MPMTMANCMRQGGLRSPTFTRSVASKQRSGARGGTGGIAPFTVDECCLEFFQ